MERGSTTMPPTRSAMTTDRVAASRKDGGERGGAARRPPPENPPLIFVCPSCGVPQVPANALAGARLEREGLCQGCRAARTFRRCPDAFPLFLAFWRQVGFPQSPSWLDAVTGSECV
jgi:hypothetical protein